MQATSSFVACSNQNRKQPPTDFLAVSTSLEKSVHINIIHFTINYILCGTSCYQTFTLIFTILNNLKSRFFIR